MRASPHWTRRRVMSLRSGAVARCRDAPSLPRLGPGFPCGSAWPLHRCGTGRARVASTTASAAVIVGTPGPDRLTARIRPVDLLFGGGGADTLIGGWPGRDLRRALGNTIDAGGGDNYVGAAPATTRSRRPMVATRVRRFGPRHHRARQRQQLRRSRRRAPDVVRLGNGNNVVNGGSGGMELTAAAATNSCSSPDSTRSSSGGGVNTVYSRTSGTCGRRLRRQPREPSLRQHEERRLAERRSQGGRERQDQELPEHAGLRRPAAHQDADGGVVGDVQPRRRRWPRQAPRRHGGARSMARAATTSSGDYHQETGGAEAQARTRASSRATATTSCSPARHELRHLSATVATSCAAAPGTTRSPWARATTRSASRARAEHGDDPWRRRVRGVLRNGRKPR